MYDDRHGAPLFSEEVNMTVWRQDFISMWMVLVQVESYAACFAEFNMQIVRNCWRLLFCVHSRGPCIPSLMFSHGCCSELQMFPGGRLTWSGYRYINTQLSCTNILFHHMQLCANSCAGFHMKSIAIQITSYIPHIYKLLVITQGLKGEWLEKTKILFTFFTMGHLGCLPVYNSPPSEVTQKMVFAAFYPLNVQTNFNRACVRMSCVHHLLQYI